MALPVGTKTGDPFSAMLFVIILDKSLKRSESTSYGQPRQDLQDEKGSSPLYMKFDALWTNLCLKIKIVFANRTIFENMLFYGQIIADHEYRVQVLIR